MGVLDSLRAVARFRTFERDADVRRMQRAANIADLRLIAKKRLPGGVFDYIDGAAEDEVTYRRNESSFHQWEFVPSVLVDVSSLDTTTTLLGKPLAFPLVCAPTGFTRIVEPAGELSVARSAARHDIPYSLSTLSTRSIEEVAGVNEGRKWFQVYVWKDRGLVRDLIDRAAAAGYEALCITVDLAVAGRRERDVRRGLTLPPNLGLDTIIEGLRKPSWTWRFLRADPITFANVTGAMERDGSTAESLSDYIADQFDPSLSWSDLEWFRSIWSGPIVVKGIQSIPDARRAVDHGVEAIALSNHGGRQLDGAPAAIDLVAPVADAVGDSIEIICDGGIRRGSDIVKALAQGATAGMVGRPYLYGLGAGGEKGVDRVLEFFEDGLRRTMALCGVTSINNITPDLLRKR